MKIYAASWSLKNNLCIMRLKFRGIIKAVVWEKHNNVNDNFG